MEPSDLDLIDDPFRRCDNCLQMFHEDHRRGCNRCEEWCCYACYAEEHQHPITVRDWFRGDRAAHWEHWTIAEVWLYLRTADPVPAGPYDLVTIRDLHDVQDLIEGKGSPRPSLLYTWRRRRLPAGITD